jgi:SRSO17 transposase
MPVLMNDAAIERLKSYLDQIGAVLGIASRRESFAIYAAGILGDGERKSTEPIAARACADPQKADAVHQRLLHFVSNSTWSDHDVRKTAAKYALKSMTARSPVQTWIIDDTGFLKQGKHSVGVQRQYTGSAGKVTNCQVGVSLTVATRDDHVPIDFELYLPHSWTDDAKRRAEARIPDDLEFKTKLQLALDMIGRARRNRIPRGIVLADSAFGSSSDFRAQLRKLGLHYAVGVDPQTAVFLLDPVSAQPGARMQVRDLALKIEASGGFRRCTWRKGTKEDLSARFARMRVVPAHDDGTAPAQREPLWLLIEWRDGEAEPANYFLSSLSTRWNKKQLIEVVMQRWRTERAYEDLKGELGLDHFEGRRFSGWHHHVSIVLCCYAFVIAERVRHFPPSAAGALHPNSLHHAA